MGESWEGIAEETLSLLGKLSMALSLSLSSLSLSLSLSHARSNGVLFKERRFALFSLVQLPVHTPPPLSVLSLPHLLSLSPSLSLSLSLFVP